MSLRRAGRSTAMTVISRRLGSGRAGEEHNHERGQHSRDRRVGAVAVCTTGRGHRGAGDQRRSLADHGLDVGHQRRAERAGGLARRQLPAAGGGRLAAERRGGPQRRAHDPRRRRAGTGVPGLPTRRSDRAPARGRRDRPRGGDGCGAHPPAHGPRRRAAHRGCQGPAAAGPAGAPRGRRGRVLDGTRLHRHHHAAAHPERASARRGAVPGRIPRPATNFRDRVRGGPGRAPQPHRRPHPGSQHRAGGLRRRGADVRR